MGEVVRFIPKSERTKADARLGAIHLPAGPPEEGETTRKGSRMAFRSFALPSHSRPPSLRFALPAGRPASEMSVNEIDDEIARLTAQKN